MRMDVPSSTHRPLSETLGVGDLAQDISPRLSKFGALLDELTIEYGLLQSRLRNLLAEAQQEHCPRKIIIWENLQSEALQMVPEQECKRLPLQDVRRLRDEQTLLPALPKQPGLIAKTNGESNHGEQITLKNGSESPQQFEYLVGGSRPTACPSEDNSLHMGDSCNSQSGLGGPRESIRSNSSSVLSDMLPKSPPASSAMARRRSRVLKHIRAENSEDPRWVFPLDVFICFVIVTNAAVAFAESEHKGWLMAQDLGLEVGSDAWGDADLWFNIFEHVFNICYIGELGLRLSYYRLNYFCEMSNVFDACIVFITSVDAYILWPLFETKAAQNLSIARLLRLFRLARVVRIFKMLRFARNLTELRVLFLTVSSSKRALLWSMLFLAFIIVGAGMSIFQLLHATIDSNSSEEVRLWIYRFYGTGGRACYTMFEATFSGAWPNYARPLVEEVSGWFACFFVPYHVVVTFAALQIVRAIFLNETLKAANKDGETLIMGRLKEKESFQKHLQEFFYEADTSGDGLLSKQELEDICKHEHVKAWLSILELETHELNALFQLLDDNGDGEISLDEFLRGAMRLKGDAKALHSIAIMHDQTKIKDLILSVQKSVASIERHLDL